MALQLHRTFGRVVGLLLLAVVAYVGWLLVRIDKRPSATVREEQSKPC